MTLRQVGLWVWWQVGGNNISQAINFQNFKILPMSSVEHYRLALLQYIHYQQQVQAVLRLQEEIAALRVQISLRHKKHRRCDRQITKDFKCCKCEKFYASDIALKLHLKLKHPRNDEKENSTEDSHGLNDVNSRESLREEVAQLRP